MDRPRRIAFLSEHASPAALLGGQDAGGQNVYVDAVSRELARQGFAVDVFTRRDRPDAPDIQQWAPGVRVINLATGPARFLPKDDLWPLMSEFRDAALHFILGCGLDYDLIHGNFWMSGWVAVELGRRLHLPVAQIFHALGRTKQRHQGSADTSPRDRIAVERSVISAADRIIAQCPSERAELIEDYGADPSHIEVIPSAVDLDRFQPICQAEARARIDLAGSDPVIVYVGRLLPRKDVRNVVRALAVLVHQLKVPARLLIVGGETTEPDPRATPEIGVLQDLAAELRVAERVMFAGKRQQTELADYYCAGDVAVTTPWYEPFGLTPLEAMACGRPVVGSDVGGISYTVSDGVTGFLVPPRDPPALALRLQQLLNDAALREEMGRAARGRTVRDFSWKVVGRRTAALYEELIAQSRRSPLAADARALIALGDESLAAVESHGEE